MQFIHKLLGRAFILAAVFNIAPAHAQTGGYAVAGCGPDYRVWQKTTIENGTNCVHQYTELATGLNHLVNGQWVPSQEQIVILPNGTAAATNGQHQAYFPGNIYSGVIRMVTPDGLVLQSRPMGMFYDDGTNTVMIAQLTNAVGYVAGSNQVVYPNAFTGFKADLRYTYTKAGFEQDIVLRQQPPTPESLGLNPDTARLQVLTEFFSPPQPSIRSSILPKQAGLALADQGLGFGKMQMIQGRAFRLGRGANDEGAMVAKQWLQLGGRRFLLEEVPVDAIVDGLAALPLTAMNSSPSKAKLMASGHWNLPPQRLAKAEPKTSLLLAKADNAKKGFVLDYQMLNGTLMNMTFQGDTTYFITGPVASFGTNTFEGATVLKFAPNGILQIGRGYLGTPSIIWNADASHPVVFTAMDDNTVGESIGSGNPAGYYGNPMLLLGAFSPPPLTGLRMSYAQTAIYLGSANCSIYDARFVNCQYGLQLGGANVFIGNALFANIMGSDFVYMGGSTVTAQNVTFSASMLVASAPAYPTGCYLALTNCVLSGLVNLASGSLMATNGAFNGFYGSRLSPVIKSPVFASNPVTNNFYPFRPVGAGGYYLTNGCSFRNAGTTNIDPALLAEIQTMTTYAPQDGGWADTNGTDLGYHYPEDSDGDGVPDWWAWLYWGQVDITDTNLDYSGNNNTFAQDYSNSIIPTVFSFTGLEVANNYVSAMNTPVQLDVAGSPYYVATLVDDDNFSNAVWSTYSGSNVTVNLGSVQGWHDVWIGLRGHADDTNNAVWQWKRLKLDFTPPQLSVTSPILVGGAAATVDVPLIQIAGFCPEALDTISCLVSNALGMTTNLDAGVTGQYYDTNTFEFTTNYFEALDVPLTNGLNMVTIQAADLAGNVTVTNLSFTLDYSNKTNPVVQLTMPLDGMKISGSSFTLRGQVDDPTVTVTASITDTNGDVSVVNGEVERNGRFWLENLPLNSGTNTLSITVSNVVGQATVTNINLVQSSLILTMTPVSDPSQLWQPTVSVGGSIADPSYAVWVNGIQGTNNGDGTWSADNVPVTPGGVAVFDVTAYPPGEAPAGSFSGESVVNPQTANSQNNGTNYDKPARLYVEQNHQDYTSDSKMASNSYNDGQTCTASTRWHVFYTHDWNDGAGGGGNFNFNGNGSGSCFDSWALTGALQFNWPTSSWPDMVIGTASGSGDIYYYFQMLPWWFSEYGVDMVDAPWIAWEHCAVADRQTPFIHEDDGQGNSADILYLDTYSRNAQATIKLQTGGKSGSQRRNLFQISSTATEQLDKYAQPFPNEWQFCSTDINMNGSGATAPIAPQNTIIDGKPVGSDGNQWRTYADNDTRDVTPRVKNKDFYTFTVGQQKYKLRIIVNGSNPLWPDNVPNYNHYCVGQKLDFEGVFTPSLSPTEAYPTWYYTADYINNHWTDNNGCEEYNISPFIQISNPTQAWFYNKATQDAKAMLLMTCVFANGQSIFLSQQGKFNVYTPSVAWSPSVLYGGFNVSGGLLWLSLGTTSGNNDGAADFSADVTSKFPGDIGITQMINGSEDFGFPDGGLSTDGNLYFDGSVLYAQTQKPLLDRGYGFFERVTDLTDCPGCLVGNNYTTIHLKFNDFVRFCPSGSDSIWVTLGRADWGWDAEASYDSSGNAILPLNNATQPIFTLSNQFPPACFGVKGGLSITKDFFWYLLFGAP